MPILILVLLLLSLAWTVYYFAAKIYHRRWLEAFMDTAGVVPWPVLTTIGFLFIGILVKIWDPEGPMAKRWFVAAAVQGGVSVLLAWALRLALWAAPDDSWVGPENANVGKPQNMPAPAPLPGK